MRPLSKDDIAEYLKSVFPSMIAPEGFEADLARVTQGNPLFLGEIIRKLVTDGKVSLVGQEWLIEALEEGYLPRSLEEIVTEKIAAPGVGALRLRLVATKGGAPFELRDEAGKYRSDVLLDLDYWALMPV